MPVTMTEQIVLTIITAVVAPVLLGILGIVTVRAKNHALILKNRAEAIRERLEAENKRILAEADRLVKEAEAKLAREKGDISQMHLVTEMMKQQVTINQQLAEQSAKDRENWRLEFLEKEKRDERNYRVLTNAMRDVGIMVTNEVKARSDEIRVNIAKMQDDTRSIIHWELVNAVADSQRQYSQRDVLKFVTGGTAIPFPREHGYAFHKCKVRIKSEKGANLFTAPLHFDQQPVGRLFDGDEVWIMWDVPFPEGWAAVNAQTLGVKGWIYKEFVSIEECTNEEVLNPT